MREDIKKVLEFCKTYKCYYQESPNVTLPEPSSQYGNLKELKTKLIQEELDELKEAVEKDDLVEILDALGDILYLTYGTACAYGVQDVLPLVFDEIHRSNMSKLDENGNPIYREDGKVQKGPNYFKPDIKAILEKFIESKKEELKENENRKMLFDYGYNYGVDYTDVNIPENVKAKIDELNKEEWDNYNDAINAGGRGNPHISTYYCLVNPPDRGYLILGKTDKKIFIEWEDKK